MESIKERIIEHAAVLFSQKGCKSLTVDDIATSMGISKRTVYENFENKTSLVQACLNYYFEQQEENIRIILKSSENIIDVLFQRADCSTRLLRRVKFDFFNEIRKYYPEVYEGTVKKYKQEHLLNSIKLLKKGQKEGVIRDDLEIDILSVLVQELSHVIFSTNTFAAYDIDRQKLMAVLILNITRGMATDKGRKVLEKYVEKYKNTMI